MTSPDHEHSNPPSWADLRETPNSAAFFAGDYVLKMNKPVHTEFVDLSTLGARDRACEDEVRLNCRLSPDVYLGVVRIGLTDEGPGEPVVVMKRLRDADRLDLRLCNGVEGIDDDVDELARCLAEFHEGCAVALDLPAFDQVETAWRNECAQLDALGDRVAPVRVRVALRTLGDRYIAGRRTLFEDRVAAGRYREGHGDLRSQHIYLTNDGVRVINCLRSDRSLRTLDTLFDLSTLVADLDASGHPAIAVELMSRYREFSGDVYPQSLLDFYVAYRLVVRANVAATHSEHTEHLAGEPTRLAAMALERLLTATPVVTCIGGLPGSGKSAVGSWVARERGDVYLSTDEIRHELLSREPERLRDRWELGDYTPEHTEAVYSELLRRARLLLAEGYSVVLDGSWRDASHRATVSELAADAQGVSVDALCQIDEPTAYARVRGSREGFSEAGASTRIAMKKRFDEWPQAHLLVTDHPVQIVAAELLKVIAAEVLASSTDCRATS